MRFTWGTWWCSISQSLEGGENNRLVHVIPTCSADKFDSFHKRRSVSSVKEMNLISVVISGHLDPSTIISPPVLVSSSCSTNETVVVDFDVEVETATSSHVNYAAHTKEVFKYDSKGEISIVADNDVEIETVASIHANATPCTKETIKYDSKGEISIGQATNASETGHMTHFRQMNDGVTTRRDKVDEFESGNPDVLYSQDLIVRDIYRDPSLCEPRGTHLIVTRGACYQPDRHHPDSPKDMHDAVILSGPPQGKANDVSASPIQGRANDASREWTSGQFS